MSFAKPGTGDTDYEKYIRTAELLSLQKKQTELANDDELFFQSIHQAMELWMKVASYELTKATRQMDADELHRAGVMLRRASSILDYLGEGFPILLTMAPADYHEIRLALGRGSGQDSPGFNALLDEIPALWTPFSRLLERHNLELLPLFKSPHDRKHQGVYDVAQAMLGLDHAFQAFRYKHLQLARREIGLAVKSLKGVPARNLEQGVLKASFPDLWKVIEDLTIATNPVYG